MTIEIPTSKRIFFRQSLEIIKILPPLNKLGNRELDLLAELLYYNNLYKNVDEKIRGKLIFDYDTRLSIREYLNINELNLNNLFTSLRKKNIITKRSIGNTYGITEELPNITFKFKFND
jgi:hypothetical protein